MNANIANIDKNSPLEMNKRQCRYSGLHEAWPSEFPLTSKFTFPDILWVCFEARKLNICGNPKLAMMSILPMLSVCENHEWINDKRC